VVWQQSWSNNDFHFFHVQFDFFSVYGFHDFLLFGFEFRVAFQALALLLPVVFESRFLSLSPR
jgi:hypothetical protein